MIMQVTAEIGLNNHALQFASYAIETVVNLYGENSEQAAPL
jgi:hypothetical protein